MKQFVIGLIMVMMGNVALAHDMVPTYPELRPSFVVGVYVTDLELFNKRDDVEYYEIGVFDADLKPVPFVTSYEIIKVPYLGHMKFSVYISKEDVLRASYVCSISKLKRETTSRTAVSSRICSKFKRG